MYKMNMNIPGWNRENILQVIGDYSAKVSADGNILELGALFGRTTYTIGYNKHSETRLTVIDQWSGIWHENHLPGWYHDEQLGEPEAALLARLTKQDPGRIDGDDFFLIWQVLTSGIPNMRSIRSTTDLPNETFPDFDLIIHDAAHDYEGVLSDLVHWFPKLKQNGVIIIDDYEPQFPGLMQAVDQFVTEHDLYTEMVTNRNILLKRK